ncbi:hypothetical protein B0H34DRAFT_657026, partial [Crassisporium funariophilum]
DTMQVEKRLLNAKFEGYKLELLPQDDAVSRFSLALRPTQSTASSRAPLSFPEMQSRISHNHLAVHSDSESDAALAVYVDREYHVCLVGLADVASPSFRVLYQLPTPIDSSASAPTVQREYPSAAFLGTTAVLAADGAGLLYVLPIKDSTEPSEPVGVFTLPTAPAQAPFRIHHLRRASPTTAVVLLSSRYYPPNEEKTIRFDVWACKIDLLSLRPGLHQPRALDVLWHRRGEDVPVFTTFVARLDAYLLMGGSRYRDPTLARPTKKAYEPTADEIAPIPRADENLDAAQPMDVDRPPKPPPYSWTQTSDSVTVAFPLPSSTQTKQIKVLFTVQTLTIHVVPAEEGADPGMPIPHYSAKALWDSINTTSSFWTWDREGDGKCGVLTLHMEKKHDGTRWMHVFASPPPSSSSSSSSKITSAFTGTLDHIPEFITQAQAEAEEDVDVPETLDPSELYHIRESMEKWTAAVASGEDASGLGLGRGVPSLAEGEMDEEVDACVGRRVVGTWVGSAGGGEDLDVKEEIFEEDEIIQLLSTPLPGSTPDDDVSLVIKHDLDGAVFSLSLSTSPSSASSDGNEKPTPKWTHTSTYPALSFVLASKQDTRFTYHLPPPSSPFSSPSSASPPSSTTPTPGSSVLAFEGGSARGRGANVYIYRAPAGIKDKWARQAVVKVDDGGGLLGVGWKGERERERVVLCLTEGELVLIRGV